MNFGFEQRTSSSPDRAGRSGSQEEKSDDIQAMLRGERGAERRALAALILVGIAWALLYLFVQGPDGFFAITLDRVEAQWVKLTFLNVPLHLALLVLAIGCAVGRNRGFARLGLWLGIADAALIAGHVVLSVSTA